MARSRGDEPTSAAKMGHKALFVKSEITSGGKRPYGFLKFWSLCKGGRGNSHQKKGNTAEGPDPTHRDGERGGAAKEENKNSLKHRGGPTWMQTDGEGGCVWWVASRRWVKGLN